MVSRLISAALIVMSAVVVVYAASGQLDRKFGVGGIVEHQFGVDPQIGAVARQQDGRLLVAGTRALPLSTGGTQSALWIARFHKDGSLDTSFGDAGEVIIDPNPMMGDSPRDIVAQANGRIVIVGETRDTSTLSRILLVRLLKDGSLDAEFGGGVVKVAVPGNRAVATAVRLQPVEAAADGAIDDAGPADPIVVAGHLRMPAGTVCPAQTYTGVVLRVLPDGALDTSFGNGGMYLERFGCSGAFFNALDVDDVSGEIVAAGGTGGGPSNSRAYSLVRLTRDGMPDTGFSGDGRVSTPSPDSSKPFVQVEKIALLRDRSVVVAGQTLAKLGGGQIGYREDFFASRYRVDGAPDMDFGTDGTQIIKFDGYGYIAAVLGLVVDKHERIIVSGGGNNSTNTCGTADFYMARLTTSGQLDADFGVGGKVVYDFGGDDNPLGPIEQPNGDLIVIPASAVGTGSGGFDCSYGPWSLFIARFRAK